MKQRVLIVVLAIAIVAIVGVVTFQTPSVKKAAREVERIAKNEPDAERIEQREKAPTLERAEKLAGRWDAVAIECDKDSSQSRWGYGPWEVQFVAADLRDPDYGSGDVTVIGWGHSLEQAAKNSIGAWYRRRAEIASKTVRQERNKQAERCGECK